MKCIFPLRCRVTQVLPFAYYFTMYTMIISGECPPYNLSYMYVMLLQNDIRDCSRGKKIILFYSDFSRIVFFMDDS